MSEIFAKRLKMERERRAWTQGHMATLLGISNGTLSGYERNYREPDLDTLTKIAELLEVSSDYLLGKTLVRRTLHTEAAHRTDDPMSDLPPEAIRSIEEFKELMRIKYGKKPT